MNFIIGLAHHSLCDSVVEHRCADSECLRFNSSLGHLSLFSKFFQRFINWNNSFISKCPSSEDGTLKLQNIYQAIGNFRFVSFQTPKQSAASPYTINKLHDTTLSNAPTDSRSYR